MPVIHAVYVYFKPETLSDASPACSLTDINLTGKVFIAVSLCLLFVYLHLDVEISKLSVMHQYMLCIGSQVSLHLYPC